MRFLQLQHSLVGSPGNLSCPCRVAVRQHEGKFLAAISRGEIKVLPYRCLQCSGNRGQATIAADVAVMVIVAFEDVDIDHHHPDTAAIAQRAQPLGPEHFVESASVREPGQRIADAECLQPKLHGAQLQMRPHAHQHLGHLKRLGDIINTASLEALNLAALISKRTHENQWDGARIFGGLQFAAGLLEPVDARHHHVPIKNKIRMRMRLGALHGLRSILRHDHPEALRLKQVRHDAEIRRRVIDHQDGLLRPLAHAGSWIKCWPTIFRMACD